VFVCNAVTHCFWHKNQHKMCIFLHMLAMVKQILHKPVCSCWLLLHIHSFIFLFYHGTQVWKSCNIFFYLLHEKFLYNLAWIIFLKVGSSVRIGGYMILKRNFKKRNNHFSRFSLKNTSSNSFFFSKGLSLLKLVRTWKLCWMHLITRKLKIYHSGNLTQPILRFCCAVFYKIHFDVSR